MIQALGTQQTQVELGQLKLSFIWFLSCLYSHISTYLSLSLSSICPVTINQPFIIFISSCTARADANHNTNHILILIDDATISVQCHLAQMYCTRSLVQRAVASAAEFAGQPSNIAWQLLDSGFLGILVSLMPPCSLTASLYINKRCMNLGAWIW